MSKLYPYTLLISLILLFSAGTVSAQYVKNQLVKDQMGRPLVAGEYVDIQGFPFLFENWTKGVVKFTNGTSVSDMDLKYDLVKDELYFRDLKTDQVMVFTEKISEFKLNDPNKSNSFLYFKNGFTPNEKNTVQSFYQILVDGTAQLIKRYTKEIFEERPYNSATTIRSFKDAELYYIVKSNQLIKIKKDKKQVLPALGDRSQELDAYIKANNINLKNESDLIRLVAHYNSL
jgi:hypothetical protein